VDQISRIGIFLEVVKHSSFSGAARQLGMTGPALSKQVQSLEEQLGVRLLNRTTRHVSLTEEGALYNEKARKALEDLAEAEQQLHELKSCPTGTLKINAPMSFGKRYLVQPIAAFAKKYPNVAMEVDFDDRRIDVISEGYDVVVRIGTLEDSSLIARKIADFHLLLCASPEYITTHGMPTSPEELTHFPAIMYSRNGDITEWRYQYKDGKIGSTHLNKNFIANNADILLEACLQGVGLSLLPIFVAATHIKSGDLIHILPDYKTHPERAIHAIFPQNRHLSTRVRLFVDCLSETGKNLPW